MLRKYIKPTTTSTTWEKYAGYADVECQMIKTQNTPRWFAKTYITAHKVCVWLVCQTVCDTFILSRCSISYICLCFFDFFFLWLPLQYTRSFWNHFCKQNFFHMRQMKPVDWREKNATKSMRRREQETQRAISKDKKNNSTDKEGTRDRFATSYNFQFVSNWAYFIAHRPKERESPTINQISLIRWYDLK